MKLHLGRRDLTRKFWIDFAIWTAAVPVAYLARFDGSIPRQWWDSAISATLIAAIVHLVVLVVSRVHVQSWRTISFRDLGRLLQAVAVGGVLLGFAALLLRPQLVIPRSVPFLYALFALIGLALVRAVRRYSYEARSPARLLGAPQRRVLIAGTGDLGALVARELFRDPDAGMEPVGFVTTDPDEVGTSLVSLPILAHLDAVGTVLRPYEVDEILIALPSSSGRQVRSVIEAAAASDREVAYRIVPAVQDVLAGRVGISRIRTVEVEDLLRREPITLDTSAIRGILSGRTVMVTGAGGSIGSEIVRQIAPFEPTEVVLFGRGENSLYAVERELDRSFPELRYRSVIGDVRDRARLERVLAESTPAVVFHAAAHKHVPLMEANPEEAVLNNIIGTANLAEVALAQGVRHFVNISTDKAVNPTSIMGASKRIGEMLVQRVARNASSEASFVSVRFGNVLGSRGSVVPLFKEQIRNGGPVTVTHRDMQRYFMTIPEATQLVLQAASMGGNGAIFVLDMGEPVKIYDLARDLIRLSGLEPEVDIDIVVTGIRPGEKLFEELLTDDERNRTTSHQSVFVSDVIENGGNDARLEATFESLREAARTGDAERVRQLLAGAIDGSLLTGAANEQERR